MKNLTIKLWIVFCLTIFALGVSNFFGVFAMIYAADITRLSFVMIGGLLLTMIYIFIMVWRNKIPDLNPLWYTADLFLSIGMIGTVIGMIYVFAASDLASIDMTNLASVKQVMIAMAVGVATKLWTTLVGLVCSNILKIYLVLIENWQEAEARRADEIEYANLVTKLNLDGSNEQQI